MQKSKAETMMAMIEEINRKLFRLEELAVSTIRADQRFKLGQKVEFSRLAKRRGIDTKRKGAVRTGKITSIDGFVIGVRLDGYKQATGYHHSFFNAVSGPELF